MAEFLRSLSNIIVTSVTILGLIAIFYKTINLLTGLAILSLLLFLGFISLIIFYITKLENKINSIEQKFKRAEDLSNLTADVKALKLMLLKNGQKRKTKF